MKSSISLILLLLFLPTISFSQKWRTNLFGSLCKEIQHRNMYNSLRQKLPGLVLVVDPIENKESILYQDTSNVEAMEIFNKYSQKEKLKILSVQPMAIFPLKDTIFVVDTIGFFPSGTTFKSQHFFKIVSQKDKQFSSVIQRQNCLFLVGIFDLEKNEHSQHYKGHTIVLNFSLINSESANFQFGLEDSKIKVTNNYYDYDY